MIIETSPLFAQSLSMVDWARSLSLAHPKLANVLLHPNSCIWPWLWHQVWRLKARRKSYKDAVMSRWVAQAAKATTLAISLRLDTTLAANTAWWKTPEYLCESATRTIKCLEEQLRRRRRIIAEQEAKMRILECQLLAKKKKQEAKQEAKMRFLNHRLLVAMTKHKRHETECRQNEFYKLLDHTMLQKNEFCKKIEKKLMKLQKKTAQ